MITNKLFKASNGGAIRIIGIFITLLYFAVPAVSQNKVDLTIGSATELTFNGTSNVHDWSCDVKRINGQGTFQPEIFNMGDLSNTPVENVKLTIPVKSIESGKSKMNDIMYDALKAEDHPEIQYELSSSEIIEQSGEEFTMGTKGYLTVAGVTRQIELQVKGKKINDHTIHFKGRKSLKMSNFNIEPPKALFGAIKSGNEVNVKFTAAFKKGQK
jgi:hypothetical protein